MAFTYDKDLLSQRDWVRFLIGDTVESAVQFSDQEINASLSEERNKYLAAARCLESLRTRRMLSTGGVTSKSVDGLSVSYSEAGETSALTARIKELREKGARESLMQPAAFRVL